MQPLSELLAFVVVIVLMVVAWWLILIVPLTFEGLVLGGVAIAAAVMIGTRYIDL